MRFIPFKIDESKNLYILSILFMRFGFEPGANVETYDLFQFSL